MLPMQLQTWIDQHPTLFWTIVFPAYFVGLWLTVCAAVSYIGGWQTLANRFRMHDIFNGAKWSMQSGQMRWLVSYGNCLTVGANPEGLFIRTMFLFSFLHPPLFIPWSEIAIRRRRFWIFGESYTLRLGRPAYIPLTIRGGLARKLKREGGVSWPNEEV